ncbi:MAG: hypothetical protein LCH89_01110 [Proteobacteria bacterium]|nr:hypothetical protein [Pseudomonadota bacterium]
MTSSKNLTLASLLALAAFSSSAWAAGPMPATGEGPLFLDQPLVASATRAEVRAEAREHPPVHGGQPMVVDAKLPSAQSPSRAEVRTQTRQAIAQGFHVATGEMS